MTLDDRSAVPSSALVPSARVHVVTQIRPVKGADQRDACAPRSLSLQRLCGLGQVLGLAHAKTEVDELRTTVHWRAVIAIGCVVTGSTEGSWWSRGSTTCRESLDS